MLLREGFVGDLGGVGKRCLIGISEEGGGSVLEREGLVERAGWYFVEEGKRNEGGRERKREGEREGLQP